jgi:hypothetical protein
MSDIKRRTFIKKGGRMLLTGGLVSIGFYLGLRPDGSNSAVDGCIRTNPCNGCGQFKRCPEPRALALKAGKTEKRIKQEKRNE